MKSPRAAPPAPGPRALVHGWDSHTFICAPCYCGPFHLCKAMLFRFRCFCFIFL